MSNRDTIHFEETPGFEVAAIPIDVWFQVFALCTNGGIAEHVLDKSKYPINIFYTSQAFRRVIVGYLPAWKELVGKFRYTWNLKTLTAILEDLHSSGVHLQRFILHCPLQGWVYRHKLILNTNANVPRHWATFATKLGVGLSSLVLSKVSTEDLASISVGSFPRLESLVCYGLVESSHHLVYAFQTAPMLKKVALQPFSNKLCLPRHGLTHLVLCSAPTNALHRVDLSNLQVLHLDMFTAVGGPRFSHPPTPELKHLSINVCDQLTRAEDICSLIVHGLKRFMWSGGSVQGFFSSARLSHLCERLKECQTLESLALFPKWITRVHQLSSLALILSSVPHIRQLELGVEHWRSTHMRMLASPKYLPNLEDLTVEAGPPVVFANMEHVAGQENVQLGHPEMMASEGMDILKEILGSKGRHGGGHLRSFTLVEHKPLWSDMARKLQSDVLIKYCEGVPGGQGPYLIGHLERNSDYVQWPEIKHLKMGIQDMWKL
jgi:hypothetical protein